MLKKFDLLFQTVRHLKVRQIIYQVKYRLIKPGPLKMYGYISSNINIQPLRFMYYPPMVVSWQGKGKFSFLNIDVTFEGGVNWNFQKNGKLWNYNLQYANYLLQEAPDDKEKEQLVTELYAWLSDGRLPLEPYPVSLRSINMIRWLSLSDVNRPDLEKNVYAELNFLSQRLEYHLLGNHLLENAFALLMGGGFFSKTNWVKTGKKILKAELEEQVLADGAHFELSPMYHQIIFFRLLELIDWYSKWKDKELEFEDFLKAKAIAMRAWLKNISFQNGDIPHFNDSASGIAYATHWLMTYADELSIRESGLRLGESGYRSVMMGNYECKIDCAQLGPSYQPGHAHADALSFVLYYKGQPLFVEQGTSTYQVGDVRERERSTEAHNTVVVDKRNQSNVWGGFRVAERAIVKIVEDRENRICGKHNGYRKLGVTHKRTFNFDKNRIEIVDEVSGNDQLSKEFHLHIYPGIRTRIDSSQNVVLSNGITVTFKPGVEVVIQNYYMANGYNRYLSGKKLIVSFKNELKTTISFETSN
ncbi:Heparinase II/III N-terminus [Parapedobacter composti]|uniref:Heparinase II/III N-terminus n=2 Tax=Parapedobacter composti TaxID=623281 RepID=A0A1I1ITD9_9SPHI|nr:Heparinase II/III N-terminus [Parapedobacter composti]